MYTLYVRLAHQTRQRPRKYKGYPKSVHAYTYDEHEKENRPPARPSKNAAQKRRGPCVRGATQWALRRTRPQAKSVSPHPNRNRVNNIFHG